MSLYNEVFENNQKWIEEKQANNSEFFEHLATGQSPEILYIGCSDSRVTAEHMTGSEPGDMFVHRNVANLVPSNDLSSDSVIEYAVDHLKVKHVVVCGHYFCGGVKAAMTQADLGLLNPWIRNIRDVYRLHQAELDAIADEDARYNRLVELNAIEQCVNVMKKPVWQKHHNAGSGPSVHAWVFDIQSGKLIDLNFDYESKYQELHSNYDLGV